MRVQSLNRENPLEEEMATHSRILAWRIPWTVRGVAKSWTPLSMHIRINVILLEESIVLSVPRQENHFLWEDSLDPQGFTHTSMPL